jgi:hypothetical protein
MASTPGVSVDLVGEAGGIGTGSDLLAIVSCMEKGTYSARLVTRTAAFREEWGRGEGLEAVAMHVETTRQPVLFARAATTTAAAIGPVDVTGVIGTSAVTFTGTPFDDEEIKIEVVTGGTIGTAGIVLKVSRDRGRTWSAPVRLGTGTSYAIGDSGVTANFAAGTLVAGDVASAYAKGPRWNAAGLSAALDAIGTYSTQPRHVLVLGELDDSGDVDDVIAAATAYESAYNRKVSIFCQLRDQYAPAAMQGAPSDVDFATDDTITRNAGSWVTDGFKVGMTITIDGTASNDGDHVVTVVTASVLTVSSSPGLALEANVDGGTISITGSESKATWAAALGTIVNGASPAAAKENFRIFWRGGRGRRISPIYKHRKRRPIAWFEASRTMLHDLHVSSAATAFGPLDGVDLNDENGSLAEFDQRVDGGLLEARIGCLMSHDELAGAYVALPLTGAADNSALSRVPSVAVGQLACRVAKAALTRCLGQHLIAQAGTGYLAPVSADRIEQYVQGRLSAALLTNARNEGQRAANVVFEISKTTDVRTPGTPIPYTVDVDGYVYAEQFIGDVSVAPGGRS